MHSRRLVNCILAFVMKSHEFVNRVLDGFFCVREDYTFLHMSRILCGESTQRKRNKLTYKMRFVAMKINRSSSTQTLLLRIEMQKVSSTLTFSELFTV